MVGKPIALADRLRYARTRRGWSIQDLVDRSRVHEPLISHIEAGVVRDPTIDTIGELAMALRVHPAWLAWGLGDEPYV